MYFEADAKYRKSENDAIKIFGAVLKQRLKKALREEEGGIYALGSSFKHYKRPYPRYSAYITFDCSPENIDALEKEALAVIKTFIEKGPTKKEVEAIKKNRILSHEKSLKKNSYWLGYLYDKARWNKNKFYDVTVSKKSLKKLTPRFIKSVSKKYITTPYLTAKLLPEAKKEK
jgi:zinc protease